MRKLPELVFSCCVAFFLAASCGKDFRADSESGGSCDEGTLDCPCYGNGTCNVGLECRGGECVGPGGGGQPGTDCPSDREDCSGTCAALASDELNCGRCGNACGTGEECSDGSCTCLSGRAACDAECVDTASDPDHCGACDTVCTAEQVCSESACSDDCAGSLTLCGRSCVDTNVSSDHCGGCDAPCSPGRICDNGECGCSSGLTACGESCVVIDEDSSHCGRCDRACASGETCASGECECAVGRERCGTACVLEGTCGTGGSGGSGGASGSGGTSGGGSGGTSGGSAGRGGAGAGGGGGGAGGSAGWPSGPPVVELLVDNSSSMYEPRADLWDALYSALMDENDGALAAFQDRVRVGFASFRGPYGTTFQENDPGCAQIETVGAVSPATVAPAMNNRAAIDAVYRALGEQGRNAMAGVDAGAIPWETPTGHSLKRVADTVAGFAPTPAGRKYIFLLTDGNPNTCRVLDPQCGQDLSVKAAQDARVLGITTLILGFGDVIGPNTGCTPTQMPCGERHLQDMANAGTNRPVQTPMLEYWYSACTTIHSGTSPGLPAAAYVPTGMGGTADYYVGVGRAALRTQLLAMFQRVVDGTVP